MEVSLVETETEVSLTNSDVNKKEETENMAERLEVSNDGINVKTNGNVEGLHGARQLASGRPRQPNKRAQGNNVSRKKLTAALRRMTFVPFLHCARKYSNEPDIYNF
jgi:hypothetical protein